MIFVSRHVLRTLGFLVVLVSAAACGRNSAGQPDAPSQDLPAVEVVQARRGTVPLRERLTGTVRASGEVAIYPQVSGPIVEVFAQNGDEVKKGDPLVRIQAPGAQPQLAQAQSAVEVAQAQLLEMQARARELEAEYKRNQALGAQGLVPLNTVDSLRAQSEAARAAANSAAAQVQAARGAVAEQREVQAQTIVRAPITGRVGQRNAEVGMRVDTQSPLFVIGRLENMRVEVPVAQDTLARLRVGHPVELRVGGQPGPPIKAAVSRISPFLEAGSFSAEVEVDIPNHAGALIPGMFVTVDVFYGESRETTLVPVSALYEDPTSGDRGVFVTSSAPPPPPSPASGTNAADASRPEPVPVPFRLVDVVAEAAQVAGVEGVQPGDWVVVVGQHLLSAQGRQSAPQARPRAIDWDRILELQQLQREDLLKEFLERQQRTATEG
ncbi:MAG TPA: efflux RND transporter periplasmic adaptor subunit [Vicinamibacterales bacterium]|nr:efflux RND transporter periplasmic adaptor subunit [Vicinamibacterales bacterium]